MFVFTFVAGLFTFQYDKPHFDPLPRLPPNRARTHTDSPVMSRSSFLSCRRFYHNFFCLCRMCLPFPSSWKILVIPDISEGKPSEPPFLLRGSISPRSPSLLTQQQQAVYKKGSPRRSCTRPSQGCSQSSTTNRTSTRRHGSHRTGQLQRSYC